MATDDKTTIQHELDRLRDAAQDALAAGDAAQAVGLLEQAVAVSPGLAELQGDLGFALEQAGNFAAARVAHARAVALEPGNALHHYNLGAACQALGEGHTAARHYVDALEIEPLLPEAYYNLGTLFYQAGHYDIAVQHYANALEARPTYAEAASNLGLTLRRLGRQEEAIAWYRKALEMRPDVAITHVNLGIVLAEAGRYEQAISRYVQALELEPRNPSIRINLSLALRGNGRLADAAEAALAALALDPAFTAAQVELGSVAAALQREGQEAQAKTVIDRWRALLPSPGGPILNHAMAALGLAPTPDRADDAYVQSVFDASAKRFDEMISALDYRVPTLVGDALARHLGQPQGSLDVLDAGCGTGLAAPVLRPWAKTLMGVDLSLAMLEQATKRGLYDRLDRQELVEFMARLPAGADLVVFGDVLCYFGDLGAVFRALAGTLRPAGLAVLTVEAADPWLPDYVLRESGRYAHRGDYVEDALKGAGLLPLEATGVTLRLESGTPVEGLLLVARRA